MGDIVSREQLTKQAMKGVGGVAGGVALLVISVLTGSLIGGLIVGGLVALVGLVMTKDRTDRKAGLVALAAGAITVVGLAVPPIAHLARALLTISGIGLLGAGVWSLIKFFKNLKRQS
jgi:hypothetical protein